jgi:hypothetical protein
LANTATLSKILTAAHAFFHRRLKCVASDAPIARCLRWLPRMWEGNLRNRRS